MTEEEIKELSREYIDSCTKRAGFVILTENIKNDFIDLFVAGYMKCLELNAGLKRNLDEEIKEQVNFSRNPKLEGDGSYYVVLHLYSDVPELCIDEDKLLLSVATGNFIKPKDMVGAIKLNIPKDALDDLESMREVRRHDVIRYELANAIEQSMMNEGLL